MLLNVHSCYSLRYGTLSLDQIIEGMLLCGYDTAVLTDINNSSASLNFIKKCRTAGLNGLAGMEFRNGDQLLYIGIAKNEYGFQELNEFMTKANRDEVKLPSTAPEFNNVFLIYPYGAIDVKGLRDNEFIGIQPTDLNRIVFEPASNYDRYVILQTVSFRKHEFKLHTQLRAVAHNLLISQLQSSQVGRPDEVFLTKVQLLNAYKHFPTLISNTNKLLGQCSFDFDFKKIKNKETFTGNRYDDKQLLQKYALDGLKRRYNSGDKVARDRVLKELDIIDNLNFSSYFLITDDICRYARSKDFYYVGRGSGANSVVAYCLGITDVCPIELNLYFERFLNPKRQSPPDFDVDFSWTDRDEIYDYIFRRYQSGHTALMGAMSTFQDRSMIREMGKVYGLPKGEIDRMVLEPDNMLNKNEVTDTILSICGQLPPDFPNLRTIHACGVLISEKPITCYSALDYPPKNLPTVQFDMHVAESIGFEKFDILSQRGLGHIKECIDVIKVNRGKDVDISNPHRFFNDPKIADQLRSANTIGCFYIESPAMRQLISKLDCDNYLTLVAASSIIRPGVASSGMMKTYIERHKNPEKVQYLHPAFKQELEDTYGVMVYQEDVMKIGHRFGGLDLADADVLRRMMSGKYRNKKHLVEIEDKFFAHCKAQDYPEEISKEVWRQMESFAGYSFNKAHSASFAVESYQSLFLKTYYPIEFMVGVLNNYGGFYNRMVYVNEAKRAGGEIQLPCVNESELRTSIQGKQVYLGFDCILNLEGKLAERIPAERLLQGEYTSLENFTLRTSASLEQLIILIRCGAFRFTGIGKKELLWEAHLLLSDKRKENTSALLFENMMAKPVLPKLETHFLEDLYDEIQLFGFCVSGSLFDIAKSEYRGGINGKDLKEAEGRIVRIVGVLATYKIVPTKNGTTMKFGTFLDVEGNFFDTVHFAPSLKKYPLYSSGLYLIEGKVVLDFGCPAIEVIKCGRMPMQPDPRSA
ncbi:DNA polymerase III subunit alpha [Sphingobacterium detergens]|uniref:DNA-directed DNA polymerase n=1 Tax=Sphingobacterium detergens TaxID=1145106 RepID=A0A420ARL9_SPHD1|nr:DNA polymerase III subunit alpha [Sphingobacterium detergens]RKE47116.1 DNA polymerase III alpha subunit [Sphingobacterium detergens]